MTSREAFEAWLGIKPCGAAHDLSWKAWQAAIQHARDVAVKACDHIMTEADKIHKITGNPHTEGVSVGAYSCAAAIKEALK